ncbi:unnamed protein product [Gongylonema pulchrum]|nr:unnamed protein product [Gongylonema pulchrum]
MQPESRVFIEQVLRKFLAAFSQDGIMNILDAMKGLGKQVLDMYDGLEKPTQQDVLKAFPTIGSFATSDVVRLILQKVAEFDLVSRTWTPAPTVDLEGDDSGKQPPKKSRHHSPDPEPVDLTDETDSDHQRKKGARTTALYPQVGDDEPMHVKELVKTK